VTKIGIMQGRLVPPEGGRFQSFPRAQWKSEFSHAAKVPVDYIEWIYDEYGEDVNPLDSAEGVETLRELCDDSGISLCSVCADYFMDRPLLRCTAKELEERIRVLSLILANGAKIGANRVVIPFVDASAIRDDHDSQAAVEALLAALPLAEKTGVELHLETSLPALEFARLLDRLPSQEIKVNYDSGNSASLGYRPADEFSAYGERIGSVHVKDRKLHGGTVPLGTGDTDFVAVFDGLRKLNYTGDFTLQVARGAPEAEVEWAQQNIKFLHKYWPG
jgi:L-ribulose-5-phosphate 3-epimerase